MAASGARPMPSLARLLAIGGVGVGIVAAGVCVAPAWAADASGCPRTGELPSDPEAEALIASIETEFRRGPRIVRMDIRTVYTRSHGIGYTPQPTPKTLWGVIGGDARDTKLLYVFSGPGRLAGTTLLIHDRAGSAEQDAMWLFLRSFDIFMRLEPKTQQVMVPGTALTYEDSRGFIPLDKYRFSFDASQPTPPAAGQVLLLGCPRSASIQEHLGYRSLRLQVDRERRIVRDVQYVGLGGRPLKSYTLLRDLEIEGRIFPAEIRLEHYADGFVSTIDYEYWLPQAAPPAELFEASNERGSFLDRLKAYATQAGLGDRIRAELERADEQLREFEERLRRIQQAETTRRRGPR